MIFERWVSRFAGMIDPERPAGGPPPNTLRLFFGWSLAGTWPVIWLATLGYTIAGITEALIFLLLGQVIDATTAGPPGFWSRHAVLLLGSAALLLMLRPLAFGLSSALQSIALAPNLFNQVLIRLNRHTLGQAVTFFDNDFAGRISQKQMQTARGVTDVAAEVINAGVFATTTTFAMVAMAGLIDPGMMVIFLAWVVAYAMILRYFLPRIRVRAKTRAGARALVTGQIVDALTNIKTVKLFAHDAFEDRAALNAVANLRTAATHWAGLAVLFRFTLILFAGALPVCLIGFGLMRWSAGAVSAGELAAVGAMSIRLAQMTGWVSWTLMNIYASIGEIEDGIRTLSPSHALTDAANAADLPDGPPSVAFEGVTFAYGRRTGGVTDISLAVAPGEKLAIVGASGAGKSTLVALMLRLYDAEAGVVQVAGRDVRAVTQNSLRNRIGMVTQETAMFNRSARDNVAYGRPGASTAEIVAAARRARAHEFILDLVDHNGRSGYDAHLGERGVKLSGGQRQRIALARAILKDAPILVLDEATSALDSEVEAEIQAALAEVMSGKTVVAIAHRLSTIARMDRIAVLDQGRIVEEGTHAALIARGGLYARFWNRQSGGFIGLTEAAE